MRLLPYRIKPVAEDSTHNFYKYLWGGRGGYRLLEM